MKNVRERHAMVLLSVGDLMWLPRIPYARHVYGF